MKIYIKVFGPNGALYASKTFFKAGEAMHWAMGFGLAYRIEVKVRKIHQKGIVI